MSVKLHICCCRKTPHFVLAISKQFLPIEKFYTWLIFLHKNKRKCPKFSVFCLSFVFVCPYPNVVQRLRLVFIVSDSMQHIKPGSKLPSKTLHYRLSNGNGGSKLFKNKSLVFTHFWSKPENSSSNRKKLSKYWRENIPITYLPKIGHLLAKKPERDVV